MELTLIKWLQELANPILDQVFILITMLGEETFMIVLMTFIYWNLDKKFGRILSAGLVTTLVVNNGLKEIFDFARPIGQEGIRSLRVETATGKAFPSGHSQIAATAFTMVIQRTNKLWLMRLCSLAILLVGISRVYLGLHYPKDVLAGWILGVLVAITVYYWLQASTKPIAFYGALILIGFLLFPFSGSEDFYKSFGLMLGFVVGVFLEMKYIKFSMPNEKKTMLVRLVLGVVILLLLKVGLKAIFPEVLTFHMIRYFMVSLAAVAGIPYLFERLPMMKDA